MSALFSLLSFSFFFPLLCLSSAHSVRKDEISSEEKREPVKYLIISQVCVDLDFQPEKWSSVPL